LVKDIGAAWSTGTDSYSAGLFSLAGAGLGISGTSDQVHFLYQAVDGDADVTVQVISVLAFGSEASTGLMMRESMATNAATAFIGVTNRNTAYFLYRPFAGATAVTSTAPGAAGPGWVRLVRTGTVFSAYWSADHVHWLGLGSQTIQMPSRIFVGIPIASGQRALVATSVVTDLTFVANVLGLGNRAPVADISAPAVTTAFRPGDPIPITATAYDPDGSIVRVDFFVDGALIGSSTKAPYSFSWSTLQLGNYNLTAVTTDNQGATATSVPVPITVGFVTTGPSGLVPAIPPVPKVAIEMTFTPSSDHDTAVSSYVLDVHRDGDAITDRPVVSTNIGKPPVSDGAVTINIDSTMDLAPGGTYYVVLRAVGPGGSSTDTVSALFSK